jgi:glycosyltransferase involved in cell wall biosynthesis
MKVSIAMITYNHGPFIAQALDSILMQETDFSYEVVVGDDCSTDATPIVLRSYGDRFGDRIRLLLRSENVGMHANFMDTLEACRGQYVALLEGDDYWTSPQKLTRQVSFLDAHPECAMCFHDVTTVLEPGCEGYDPKLSRPRRPILTINDLLRKNPMHTCSVMFRRGLFGDWPSWYFTLAMGDWPLHILNAEHGNIGYVDEVMAAYRVHPGGAWATQPQARRVGETIRLLEHVEGHLTGQAKRAAQFSLARHYFLGARIHFGSADWTQARRFMKLTIRMCLLYILATGRNLLRGLPASVL